MNADLIKFLMELSKADKKTLTGKGLKAAEELGEVARHVLPYESAFATTHRFVERVKILDACADMITCGYDLAFTLGYSYGDVEDMIGKKAKKWAGLQARERGAKWPVPFEIHITVKEAQVESFKTACTLLGVKPLLIDLQDQGGETIFHDLQTSSVHSGTNTSAYAEMRRISERLTKAGFEVIREKIETVPWHPAAPSREHDNETMPPNCYFECHFGLITDEWPLDKLRHMLTRRGCRLSRNIFKKVDEKRVKVMATYRAYEGVREDFEHTIKMIADDIESADLCEIDDTIIEFSVYDTKMSHDASWMTRPA